MGDELRYINMIIYEKIREAKILTDSELYNEIQKKREITKQELYDSLLQLEILGLVKVYHAGKDRKRIELVEKGEGELAWPQ